MAREKWTMSVFVCSCEEVGSDTDVSLRKNSSIHRASCEISAPQPRARAMIQQACQRHVATVSVLGPSEAHKDNSLAVGATELTKHPL